MKRFALAGIGIALVAVCITGCSWETGSDADSWSSSYDWVNFSGVYRSSAGGLLVTDYTTTPSTAGSTNIVDVSGEGQGSYTANVTAFEGTLQKTPIVPGSVVISFGYFSASDNGNGVLNGPMGSGTISYTSGAWTYSGASMAISAGTISATYSYYVSNDGTSGSGAVSGATGSIYSFTVVHQGQNLTFTDSNGATYTGYISSIASASGAQNTDITQVASDETANDTEKYTYYESALPEDGDTIIADFEVSGISAAAMSVTIVGTLNGTVASGVFTGRTMEGTWIEVGGKTGNISGQTTAVSVSTTSSDTTDTTDTTEE